MKKIKKPISLFLSLILILSVFTIIPASAWSTVDVYYLDLEGSVQQVIRVRELGGYTPSIAEGFYAVSTESVFDSRVTFSGNVRIVLFNGATLTAAKGITVEEGSSLTIWQEKPEEGKETGKLIVGEPDDDYAGIGSGPEGAGGTITINGGIITAKGGANGAGIGGTGSTVTINRGTVTAKGGANGAGIGGTGSTVTINRGTVTATGGSNAAGISGSAIALNNAEIPYSEISITSDRYSGAVTLGDSFADGNGSCFPSGPVSDNSALAGKTLVPPFFTVTWKNENGAVLETDEKVPYGSTPTFDSARPTKYSDNNYSYNFAGWTPEVTSVDRDVVYTAKYTAVPWTIPYIDENGEEQVLTPDDYTEIRSSTSSGWLAESGFSEGWNVVRENVTCSKRWSVSGSVDLLLCSGTTFYVPKGINVTEGSSLTIWQQNEDGALEPGKLIIDSVDDYLAGIGGRANNSCGTVTINGGIVTVKGGKYSAGIGGATYIKNYPSGSGIGPGVGPTGDQDDDPVETSGGNITINGGTVTATGGEEAAGIGGGSWGTAGEITISGGTVTANGFTGIGSGKNTSGGSATLKWTEDSNDTMSVYASGCNVTVTLENTFKDSDGVLYEVGAVDGDTIAGKTLTPAFCTVTWKDHDGSVLGTDDVDVGTLPAYGGTTPVRPSDENYTYTFGGWTPEVSEAFEDATYIATYTATYTGAGSILGDADGNGVVNILDATAIQRVLADYTVNRFNLTAANITGGGLNIIDATTIQRYLADYDVPYEIGKQM